MAASSKPVQILIVLSVLAAGIALATSLRSSRIETRLRSESDRQSHRLVEQGELIAELRQSIAKLERDLVALELALVEQREHESAAPAPSPSTDDTPPQDGPWPTLEESVREPFVLASELPEETRRKFDGERKIGQLLHEVRDGYIGVSLYSGSDELPVTRDTVAVYKELARLNALQHEHKSALVRRKLESEDYWTFPSAFEVAEFTQELQADPEKRRYFEVIEREGEFVVIDLAEHYESDVYRVTMKAEVDLLLTDDRITSTGASHLPSGSADD